MLWYWIIDLSDPRPPAGEKQELHFEADNQQEQLLWATELTRLILAARPRTLAGLRNAQTP
jgi:hypothetical protein